MIRMTAHRTAVRGGLALLGALGVGAGAPAAAQQPIAVRELAPGVRLEIMELKRVTGDLVHLTFVVVNETDEEVDARTWGIVGGTYPRLNASPVSLLDLVNLKRYLAGNSARGSTVGDVPAHGKRELWSQFKAPPADVTVLTVEIPMAAPLYDLPISGT